MMTFDLNRKADRELLAFDLSLWLFDVCDFYEVSHWTAIVSKTGEYLPCEVDREVPSAFKVRTGASGLLAFFADPWANGCMRFPHRYEEVMDCYARVYYAVCCALHNLVGSSEANKLLAEHREVFNLPKWSRDTLFERRLRPTFKGVIRK